MKSLLLFPVLLSLSRYFSTLFHFANAALVNQTIDDSEVVFSYSPSANWLWPNNASCLSCLQPNLQDAFQGTLHYAIHASGPDADDIGESSSLSPSASEAPVPPSPASALPHSILLPPSSASPPPTAPAVAAAAAASPPPSPSAAAAPSSVSPPPYFPAPSSPSPPPPAPSLPAAVALSTNRALAAPSGIPPSPPTSTDESGGDGKGDLSRRELPKLRRADPDDPNSVDVNVMATMNFTGSAFYVFCALPVQINSASTLALTNLTFFLDGRLVGNYTHDPQMDTGSTTGFQYQVLVFSKNDIPYAPHVLVIKPALGSILLLDYVQYTTLDTASGKASESLTPQAAPSGSLDSAGSGPSKQNTTTFAVAIGSTMGVLAVLSFGVFISICVRRRKSAKREKLREALEAANRPPSPEMRGPRPFIPRYFPGNMPPRAYSPPPFSPLTATSSRGEESGPSHGLDFPPVPDHLNAPAYSPPPLVLSEARSPRSLLAPTTPIPPPMEELQLPHYHDVERTPLVSIPMFTHTPAIPPGAVESSSSSFSRPEGGNTPSSSLLPGRSDINQEESATGRTNISTTNNSDEQHG